MKRIFSIVLSIVLALTIIPFYAGAESSSEIKVGDSIEFGSYYQTSDGNGGFNKEPIKWNVLKVENGKALLLSSKIIDAARYNNTSATVNGYYGNNYAHSEVRKWLIDDFYNSAFTENEKKCILETTLDNSACATDYNASGSYNKYSSESTTDKVFLLSKNEIDTLASKYMNKSVTDYAKSRGFQQIVSTEACNAWLTRTAGNNTFQIYYVQIRWGKWTTYYNWNDDKITVKMGACPAIWVDMKKINQSKEEQEKSDFSIGDKITLGNYNNEPITWVCVLIDDNGPLFLSEKILCKKEYDAAGESAKYHTDGWGYIRKQYGSSCWEDSNIRQWLNTRGKVEYTHCSPSYAEEDGFLSSFTESELDSIKEVTHQINVNIWENQRTGYCDGGSADNVNPFSGTIDYDKFYHKNVTDKVMLLDYIQTNKIWNSNKEYLRADENYFLGNVTGNNFACYEHVNVTSGSGCGNLRAYESCGIRPAIYIDATKKVNNGPVKGSYTWLSDTQIRINSTWYDIDENVEGLKSYISKLSLFTQVSCYVKDGAVVACSTADKPVSPFFSVTPSDRNIKFDADSSSFSKESIQLFVDITNGMREKGVGWETLEEMSFTFDSFSIYVDDPMYFKHGLFGLFKTNSYTVKLDHPVTIHPGYSYNIDEEINVFFDSKKMSETVKDVYGNAEANISLSVSNSGNSVGSAGNFITITDNQIQNSSVNTSVLDSSYASAGSQLNSCISSIKLENEFLREIFSDNDWNAIKTDIVCKAILKEIPKSSYENVNISKKALNKLIGKIGVNTSIIPVMRTETITTRAFVSSEKYGDMEVDITVKMNYPAVGNDGAFAAYSLETADYKIKGSKKVPADKRSGTCICTIALANISQFASSVERVSMSEIENAYNMCYGNDLNQFCDMFFGNVVTKIISKTEFKSYSHSLFKLLSYPSTAVSIFCPVDVYVYNNSGELCASVVDNEAECSDENIMIDVNGDEKKVKVYGEDYSVKLVGTAYSEMDVEVVNYASYNDTLRTVRYNNVELEPGKAFSLDVKDDDYSSNNYDITVNENETIEPDSDSFSVHRAAPGDWDVQRDATCTKNGLSMKKCTVCGEIVETKETSALGHVDDNGDKICDRCGDDITDIQKNCKHICHSTNRFLKFIWKIANFIHRIFGINKHCSCGLKHY